MNERRNFQIHNPKILIIAASIGSGHIKAAEAVASGIAAKNPAAETFIVDFTDISVSPATAFMKRSYLSILRFVPNLYEIMYRFTGGRAGGLSMQGLVSLITARDVARLLKKYEPDAVVCTHPFPAGAAAWLKTRGEKFPLATLITDYSLHQMWIYRNCDLYFVAREAMKTTLIASGLSPSKILVTGIPVDAKFYSKINLQNARKKFGADEKMRTVLIMGGGLGLGGIEESLCALEKTENTLQIIVVAGKNEKLALRVKKFSKKSKNKIIVLNYTENIHELMAISEFIVTKPGALTISEALVAGIPMVLHGSIPGPETENAVYMARHNAAIWTPESSELRDDFIKLLNDPELSERIRKSQRDILRPHAAENIANAILNETMNFNTGEKV